MIKLPFIIYFNSLSLFSDFSESHSNAVLLFKPIKVQYLNISSNI